MTAKLIGALVTAGLMWVFALIGRQSSVSQPAVDPPDVQAAFDALAAGDDWTELFNGRDLAGWSTKLEPAGQGRDGEIFTATDGVLRISGAVRGAITLDGEHGDYHLQFKTKWDDVPADLTPNSGLLYHGHGEADAVAGVWYRSVECQGQRGSMGDTHFLGGPKATVTAEGMPLHFDPAAPRVQTGSRIVRRGDVETDGWNRVDLIVRGDEAWHAINGRVVMHLTNLVDGDGNPLTRGRLQLQSEGSPILFRKLRMKPVE